MLNDIISDIGTLREIVIDITFNDYDLDIQLVITKLTEVTSHPYEWHIIVGEEYFQDPTSWSSCSRALKQGLDNVLDIQRDHCLRLEGRL